MKKAKQKKRRHISTVILILVFIIGLSLLLYPTVSEYWNARRQSRAIANYVEVIETMDTAEMEKLKEAARAYNEALQTNGNRWHPTESEHAVYMSMLDPSGTGIIGYVSIPRINISLPVYHTTDDAVLQNAAGHFEGSSLPVGGAGTHSVLSGHRGLPSALLFTDLDQMKVGDVFQLKVLDETLTYEVDQIRIVLPAETQELDIDPQADYCTLLTCTPYGVNTHRLLVRGHRIDTIENLEIVVASDAMKIDPALIAPLIAVPILLLLLVGLLARSRKNSRKKRRSKKTEETEKEDF